MGFYEFLDNRRTLWFALVLVVALIVITIVTTGQMREVLVQGNVWEWVNAPEGEPGMVYAWEEPGEESENWAPPPGVELKPLGGAYIIYNASYRGRHYEKVLAISYKDGHFSKKTRDWKVAGTVNIDMKVEKEGYNTLYAAFDNKGKPNVVHIIMTPQESFEPES